MRYKEKRAISLEEHRQIVGREKNPELKAFYQMAWHLGASQSDLAHLQAEDVDWQARINAWAERAKVAGYPERFAQLGLGHNSKAVHRAYARKAQVTLPPLEEYKRKIVPLADVVVETNRQETNQTLTP